MSKVETLIKALERSSKPIEHNKLAEVCGVSPDDLGKLLSRHDSRMALRLTSKLVTQ